MSRSVLATLALLTVLAGIAPSPAAGQDAPAPRAELPSEYVWHGDATTSQLFHITLVAASRRTGGSAQGDLPKAVAKALDDIKDFLPYQGYRVVDSALVRASREFHTRLNGPDGSQYQADAVFSATGRGESFLVEHFELGKPMRLEDMARELERAEGRRAVVPPAPTSNLTASFRIDRGETVVVGSSRLDGGDEALIVLLTAVP